MNNNTIIKWKWCLSSNIQTNYTIILLINHKIDIIKINNQKNNDIN